MSGIPHQLIPKYTTFDSVKLRLTNKVQFQENPEKLIDGELPNELLAQLICDAETEVEQDLRKRYAIPFRSKKTGFYKDLPDHSKRAFRTVVDLKAVLFVIENDFGRGSHIDASKYIESSEKHYLSLILKLLGEDKEENNSSFKRHKSSPPLEDVLLALSNREADDGFKGRIINTDGETRDSATYAAEQIDNPAASYVARRLTNPAGG